MCLTRLARCWRPQAAITAQSIRNLDGPSRYCRERSHQDAFEGVHVLRDSRCPCPPRERFFRLQEGACAAHTVLAPNMNAWLPLRRVQHVCTDSGGAHAATVTRHTCHVFQEPSANLLRSQKVLGQLLRTRTTGGTVWERRSREPWRSPESPRATSLALDWTQLAVQSSPSTST